MSEVIAWALVAVAISLCVPAAYLHEANRRNWGLAVIGLSAVLIFVAAAIGGQR